MEAGTPRAPRDPAADPVAPEVAGDRTPREDERRLHELGYRQELSRAWSGKGGSWVTGWFNIVGLVGIVSSVAYGCAFFLFNTVSLYGLDIFGINFGDDKHVLSEPWLLFFIILALYTLVNIFADRILALMNNISVGWHLVGVAVIIALFVFVPDDHQSASFVFGERINNNVGQFFCGAAGLTSASRTWYAFSRDRGMPGWATSGGSTARGCPSTR